jgi:NAD(P)-dependent dehydrogenase (short-subunit alcohol dehydrogenase family)
VSQFSGKVVIVTGGAGGIGAATALAFLAEGARVAILDKAPMSLFAFADKLKPEGAHVACNDSAQIDHIHPDVLPIIMDLTIEDGVRRAIDEVVRQFGKIDILFNNCGVGANLDHQLGRRVVMRGIADMTEEDFDLVLATNLKSAIWLTKYSSPHMPKTEASCIISSSSIWSAGRKPGALAYTASKAALTSVTLSLAYEVTPVRAVALILGAIDTPMFRFNPRSAEEIATETLARRPGRPDEVAEAVLFIAACHYLNATEIILDGGALR